jgi:hypothetical protein
MTMADNKTKPTKVSVAAFISAVADEGRRADAKALVALMQKVTGEKPAMWGPSIVGFGTHHYVYESGREGDMPIVAFSPRKPALVLYALSGAPGADALLAKMGKFTMGKGCIYVKKLAEIDLKVLGKLVAAAVKAKTTKAKRG